MKNNGINIKPNYPLILGLLLILAGCNRMSEKEIDASAGLNGGFEVSKNGLPVNWLLYTPNTVPSSDFTLSLDTVVFKEGKQSLRYDVNKCSSTGGRHSPGFTNEFFEIGAFKGEGIYKIGFWIKNNKTKFRINAGAVSQLEGEMKILIESSEKIKVWKYFEFEIKIPHDQHLRMELNILNPGTFWIDDIQIDKI